MLKNWHKNLRFEDCYKLEFTGIPGKILKQTIKGIVECNLDEQIQPYLVLCQSYQAYIENNQLTLIINYGVSTVLH